MNPILEGLVTTTNADGTMHLAPMGPRVDFESGLLVFRPFPTSHTFRNLKRHGQGVFHVTDDVEVLARAALGEAGTPAHRLAEFIAGFALTDACRYHEFQVTEIDEASERMEISATIAHSVSQRDFWGLNRGKHAVVEAAILATRLHLLPFHEVAEEYRKLRILVDKTGGPAEHRAFDYLEKYLHRSRRTEGQG